MTRIDYVPLPGFYDLREFAVPKRQFSAFVRIQHFLYSWELARQRGVKVPEEVKNVSAIYQQALFVFAKKGAD